jgi:glycosyltransferase involved in cell wall biosynthesis
MTRIGVIIPVLNEAGALPTVLAALPPVTAVIVADGGSTDGSQALARALGARVVDVPGRGYGRACLAALAAMPEVDIVVFVDGDAADDLTDFPALVGPILSGDKDLMLVSRAAGTPERGALTPQQVFGNWLACALIRLVWRVRFTDLGPFRAISANALRRLGMRDQSYGWTVEMQVAAARAGLRCGEIPGRYRRRIGTSKVSGTLAGSVKAGATILWVIAREAARRRHRNAAATTQP